MALGAKSRVAAHLAVERTELATSIIGHVASGAGGEALAIEHEAVIGTPRALVDATSEATTADSVAVGACAV